MIRRFNHGSDYQTYLDWYAGRPGADVAEMLPAVGLIDEGLALGFMVETNTKGVYIENVLTNPDGPVLQRANACIEIVGGLLNIAKDKGYNYVTFLTEKHGIAALGEKLGAHAKPNLMVIQGRI